MKHLRTLLAALLLGAAFASHAVLVTETGDAGDALATANDAAVPGLTLITGALSNEFCCSDLVDIYRVSIPYPTRFTATTIDDPALIADPVLFLFDASGVGVAMDDESAGNGKAYLSLSGSVAAGIYYLAVAFAGMEPLDGSGNPIFDAFGSLAVLSGDPLASWGGAPFATDPAITGAYAIAITIPEIGTLLLAGLGIGVIPALRKSRRRRA